MQASGGSRACERERETETERQRDREGERQREAEVGKAQQFIWDQVSVSGARPSVSTPGQFHDNEKDLWHAVNRGCGTLADSAAQLSTRARASEYMKKRQLPFANRAHTRPGTRQRAAAAQSCS